MPVPKNEIEKNKNVSIIDPQIDEVIGAKNQIYLYSVEKFEYQLVEQSKKRYQNQWQS